MGVAATGTVRVSRMENAGKLLVNNRFNRSKVTVVAKNRE